MKTFVVNAFAFVLDLFDDVFSGKPKVRYTHLGMRTEEAAKRRYKRK